MPARVTSELAARIVATLGADLAARRVLRRGDLLQLVRDRRAEWSALGSVTLDEALRVLVDADALTDVRLTSESGYPPLARLVTPGASPFELALSLRANSYLSHATAVFLHGLTEQIPQTLHVNAEQSAKPRPTGRLTQSSVDRAFNARQRTSRYAFIHGRNRFLILSGKQSGNYGVVEVVGPTGETLRVTDLERTLIDITVRPTYGNGVHEVLAAFRAARDRVSIERLISTLKALDHVYPYHQALGFYLERAGIPGSVLEPLRNLGLELDFYLAHGLKNPALDPSWRVFHPKGL